MGRKSAVSAAIEVKIAREVLVLLGRFVSYGRRITTVDNSMSIRICNLDIFYSEAL